MTKKIKSRTCVTVVVKEVVINIYIFFCWMGIFVVFNQYWHCLRSFVDIKFFKDVVNTKCTILYYYRYRYLTVM